MPKAIRARTRLPDDIVVWEILLRLPPNPLLRCRSVCRAWHRVTSTRGFLLAHHDRQPGLPLFSGEYRYHFDIPYGDTSSDHYQDIFVFDHRAATDDDQLHAVAQLDGTFQLKASCDGLLILFKYEPVLSTFCISICNPATREHAPLRLLWDFDIMGMYSHNPTGKYRLLLQRRRTSKGQEDQIGCYVYVLGSDQPPRYIGWPDMALGYFNIPTRVRDSLHWHPVYYSSETDPSTCGSKGVVVFDTISESFRRMRAPVPPTDSYIFELDGTLGIHSRDHPMENIDIWALQNYECEVWNLKWRIKLPAANIRRQIVHNRGRWDLYVLSVDDGVLLLVKVDGRLLHVDNDGNLVNSFYRGRSICMSGCRLKQSLVRHTFFRALEGYVVNASPFAQLVD